jgi:hypothetical protein
MISLMNKAPSVAMAAISQAPKTSVQGEVFMLKGQR